MGRSPSKRSSLRQPLLPGSSSSNAQEPHAQAEDLEAGLPEAPQTSSVLRLLREAKPEAWTLSVATFFLLIGSLANLAVPKIAGECVTRCSRCMDVHYMQLFIICELFSDDGINSLASRIESTVGRYRGGIRQKKPERKLVSTSTTLGHLARRDVANACAGGLIDACTQAASGTLTPTQAQAVLNQQLEYVVGILLIGGVASGLRAYLFNAAAERVMCRLRVQLFSKVRKVSSPKTCMAHQSLPATGTCAL